MTKVQTIAENRRARFDVAVEETLEAGIVLTGDEIKSIRADRAQLTGSYVRVMHGDRGSRQRPRVVLIGLHLSNAEEPDRARDLLLHAKEVSFLEERLSAKGKTAVPLALVLKNGWAKLQIGIGTGRKGYDKRELLKERDIDRENRRILRGKG